MNPTPRIQEAGAEETNVSLKGIAFDSGNDDHYEGDTLMLP